MIENTKGILKHRGWQEDAVKKEASFVHGMESVTL